MNKNYYANPDYTGITTSTSISSNQSLSLEEEKNWIKYKILRLLEDSIENLKDSPETLLKIYKKL